MDTRIHEDFSRSHRSKDFSDRSLGFTFAAFFALLAVWPWLRHKSFHSGWLILSAVFLLIGWLAPGLLHPVARLWAGLGRLLQRIVNPIVTSLIFYLVFVPMGLVFRLLGKDPLRMKIERNAETYWMRRNPPGPAPQTMRNQF